MFCKHKWKVLDKEVIPSPMSTREIRGGSSISVPSWMFKVVVTVICVCEKCGKIKRYVTESQ